MGSTVLSSHDMAPFSFLNPSDCAAGEMRIEDREGLRRDTRQLWGVLI